MGYTARDVVNMLRLRGVKVSLVAYYTWESHVVPRADIYLMLLDVFQMRPLEPQTIADWYKVSPIRGAMRLVGSR